MGARLRRGKVFLSKVARVLAARGEAAVGRLLPLAPTLEAMALRPFELHLELTNLCNANCVFCPYQVQERAVHFMSDEVFEKAVSDFVRSGGGSVGLTPIVGDALIDPKFLDRLRALRGRREIDRIWLTTNAILLDKHGVEAVLDAGLSAVTISTAGFDEATYQRVYRSSAYQRMRRNVLSLVEANARRARPIPITIGIRTDRSLEATLADPDFQPILAYDPQVDFTWSYTSANGRIKELPPGMAMRRVRVRAEPCVQLYHGPIVLADGTVLACSCVAAIDATRDLGLGNVLQADLAEIWRGERMRSLRRGFEEGAPNPTCAGCDMYRDLGLYRSREGRARARLNRARHAGQVVHRTDQPSGPFSGG